ncbi:MAG: hypothetical protein IPJ41_12545 [Phycisphaerales bacterium]|nr:hypothetical protein [Phycisphaerales bacterium]
MLIGYPFLCWRFYGSHPVLSRNISAEHNARFANIPESDLAAPLYREALEHYEALLGQQRGTLDREWPEIYPGDPLWPDALAYLDRSSQVRDLLLRASAKPFAGFHLSLHPHLYPDSEPAADPASVRESNPPALDLSLDSLGAYRAFARLLSVDARAAAESGDAARGAASLLAMFGIARHSGEHGLLISDLVALAIDHLCIQTLADVLVYHPDLFDDAQLRELERAQRAFRGGGPLRADFKSEEDFLADAAQRLYTDNGKGDGRICADGLRMIDTMAGGPGRLSAGAAVFGPINAEFMPSRLEFTGKYHDAIHELEALEALPLWEWKERPADVVERSIATDALARAKFRMLLILLPAMGKALDVHETFTQTRDAGLVMIALARYRLDHGAYPAALVALVPDYLAQIPPDRFDGSPIKYRLTDEGTPLLYSVGANRTDDGGVPCEGDTTGARAMKWCPPAEASLAAPGDWILYPSPRPEPYTDED